MYPPVIYGPSRALLTVAVLAVSGACSTDRRGEPTADTARPTDVPQLHHAGLNSTDPDAAIEWYLALWPTAARGQFAGRPALAAEMYLVFEEVADPPEGAFDPALGRSVPQSAFWHIGAFMNTTSSDVLLTGMGTTHLPLHTGRAAETVWRSGLTPYSGIVGEDALEAFESAPPRAGGFSYVLAPDGALFELTGGERTTPSLSHVHFFHEQPQCTANWYVEVLGMSLPPVRNEDGTTSERPPHEPCEADRGGPGWPSLEEAGTIRQPRGTVVHGNGSMSWYPRQCDAERCGTDAPLAPSRGQVIDHLGMTVGDLDAWYDWLVHRDLSVIEEPHTIEEGRAFMFEGPDRLAIELIELAPTS